MGEMALGYGSEYQLLRFLGHHRKYLDNEILKPLNKKNVRLEWLDSNIKSSSFDKELKGVECFENEPNYDFIKSQFELYNWVSSQNRPLGEKTLYLSIIILSLSLHLNLPRTLSFLTS